MKKVLIFIIGFLVVSCSNDDTDCDSSITNTNLVSITKKYYSNNNFTSSEKLNFYDNKLINILNSDESYEDYQYANDLVYKVLRFEADDSLFWTITYLYDSMGRIVEIKRTPSATNQQLQTIAKYSFVYTSNQILVTVSFSPGDTTTYELILNQQKKITSEKRVSINGNTILNPQYNAYNYLGENLSEFYRTNLPVNSTPENKRYSYNNIKNDFNYNKYLFGNEWKINYCLDQFSRSLSVNPILEVTSENLVSSAVHNYSNGSENTTFNYVFNEKNQIVNQVVIKNSTFLPVYRSEAIYEYK